MRILVIDGQGGKIGRSVVEHLRNVVSDEKLKDKNIEIIAVGTNSIATTSMLKAGADAGATGENPVIVNCDSADFIIGPAGIVMANTLLGEITPAMAVAVSSSRAKKILIPVNKCNNIIVGTQESGISEYVRLAIEKVKSLME